MIYGHKPSAHISHLDANGNRRERELLMCVHCQFMWEYVPGETRGWCMKCMGFTCGQRPCMECVPFMKKIDLNLRIV